MVLIHSPLVGSSTWSALAPVAAAAGFDLATPDLTGVAAAATPRSKWFVDTAVRATEELDGPIVVVGHSGAGVMLPSIAAELGGRCAKVVFLDATVPPTDGAHRPSAPFLDMLDRQTVDGSLNPWLTWWPNETVDELLPDAELQQMLLEDMPRLPRAFYDEVVPVPDGWTNGPNAYVQLSPAYADEHRAAAERGWPTATIASTHLGILTDPETVMGAIVNIIDR